MKQCAELLKNGPAPGIALALALSFGGTATAQVIPGSGELLQQTAPPAPPTRSAPLKLKVEQPAPTAEQGGEPFLVLHIEIRGNTLLPSAELRRIVAQSEGKMLNLANLEALAGLITQRYRERGYLLSSAYVPAQTLSDHTVHIAVLEAVYGDIMFTNASKAPDKLLNSYLKPLAPGTPITESGLQRSLLLLSDVPGTVVNSTLAPGVRVAASDLDLSATAGAPYGGSVGIDNAGNRYTGRARLSAALGLNNPLGLGDVLSLNGLTAGPDLGYVRVGYTTLLDDGEGTTVGGALSGIDYHLGNDLTDLHAHGTAAVATLSVMQPLIRDVAGNLYAQAAFDSQQLRDEVDATDIHTDRHTNALTLTLAADRRDPYGVFNINATINLGRLGFSDEAAGLKDASSARTSGSYARYTFSLARLQRLSDANSIYLAVNGQAADKNLDPSEQFFLGGPNSVRAYDVGTLGGAQGAFGSAELRHDFGRQFYGVWQAIAFVDGGIVRIYKDTFEAGDNGATLSGAGLGANWTGRGGWTASLGVAKPVGPVPALVAATASLRVWAELRKSF
jgi:hemolysin activation/secretion protein